MINNTGQPRILSCDTGFQPVRSVLPCQSPRRNQHGLKARVAVRGSAFTLMETLVLLGIFAILLSIFVPYLLSIRESNRRIACEGNLNKIRDAFRMYARDNNNSFPRVVYDSASKPNTYTAFSGPDAADPFAPDSAVRPNDVTASLWLLVRGGIVTDTRIFICPSTNDRRDPAGNAAGELSDPAKRSNFRGPANLSYSYASPFSSAPGFRTDDTKPSGFVLMADKNPGEAASQYPADAPATELALANSPNHGGAGQNVLYVDGHVAFQRTPYCGVGLVIDKDSRLVKTPGDNIYSARAASPTTLTAALLTFSRGVVRHDVGPVGNDDSYVVPTAADVPPPPQPPIPARPAISRPTATTASASVPASAP